MNHQSPNPKADSPAVLPSQRLLFDIPEDVAYLNSAYMGPMPKIAVEAGERGLRAKLNPWTIAPADFFTESEAVRGNAVNAVDDTGFFLGWRYGLGSTA